MATTKMTLEEVTVDTELRLFSEHGYIHVQARNPAGGDGPWIGTLKAIPAHLWTNEMKRYKSEQKFSASFWMMYPIKKDGYTLDTRSIGWAYGRNNAARVLRGVISQRRGG